MYNEKLAGRFLSTRFPSLLPLPSTIDRDPMLSDQKFARRKTIVLIFQLRENQLREL